MTIDIEAVRLEVRALDYVRGTPAEAAMWREDDEDARANLAIEGMPLGADDDALFDMLRNEAVPPPLATAIVLKLLGHPDADPALAITPISAEPDHARGRSRCRWCHKPAPCQSGRPNPLSGSPRVFATRR